MDTKKSLLLPLIMVVVSSVIIGWYFFFRSPITPSSEDSPEVTPVAEETPTEQEPITADELVGIWQLGYPSIGTPWGDIYRFFPSGEYTFAVREVQCDSVTLGYSGYWKLDEKGQIWLTRMTNEILEVDDDLICGPSGGLQGGFVVSHKYSDPRAKVLGISRCDDYIIEDLERSYPCISFKNSPLSNGDMFLKHSNDPTSDSPDIGFLMESFYARKSRSF
jgi:hypothetical protein